MSGQEEPGRGAGAAEAGRQESDGPGRQDVALPAGARDRDEELDRRGRDGGHRAHTGCWI